MTTKMVGSRPKPGARGDRQGGFTIIEVVLGLTVLVIATLALGLSLQAGAVAARELREHQVILAQAETLLDRIVAQEFGHPYDSTPTADQLEEVFDNDVDAGDITLHQLSVYPIEDEGWRFALSAFPVAGEWRVKVDRDLNDNGLEDGDLEIGQKVFRVSVFFDDRLILQTIRSKEVAL